MKLPARHVTAHLILGFIAIAGLATVVFLARQITAGSAITHLDVAFAKSLIDANTPEGLRFFRFVTLLGTGSALAFASTVVGAFLLLRRRFGLAVGWGIAQVGAVTLVKVIKALVERTRPGLGDPSFYASGFSFPSGHVVRTLVFCGMGAYLVFRLSGSRRAAVIVAVVGALWSVVMAFSRLYLGAHFASDVVAGLIVGASWIAVCIAVIEESFRRRALRSDRGSGLSRNHEHPARAKALDVAP